MGERAEMVNLSGADVIEIFTRMRLLHAYAVVLQLDY